MQAIVLAAGMGKRLKKLTQNNTKCMVKVNGETLIERMLRQLDRHHLSRIVIVVGYEGQKLIDYIATLPIHTQICYVNNPIYDCTNNIYSLALAKDFLLEEDTLLIESDLIFEDAVLEELLSDPRETLALVDKYEAWMDGTCIKVGEDDTIEAFVPGNKFQFNDIPNYYKTVNIYKFSRHFSQTHYVPFLDAYTKALGENEYYEQVLRVITMLDDPEIKAKKLTGQLWYEIDDIQDLDIASSIFSTNDDERVFNIQSRYGGYWRYPRLLDFCYLVNPYFPPKRLINEIKASFDELISQYPSGMRVNSLLAAKNFSVNQEHILVGNGAAELIKALMEHIDGKIGLIRPTFEEYPNRINRSDSVIFIPNNDDYSYNVKELMAYFSDKELKSLVLINPDNPSGNYIPKKNVIELIGWCRQREIQIIVDESFVDFADEQDSTLIDESLIQENPNLVILKSISKSYGVPGLRLGILVTYNTALVATLKKEVSIWNINSFAEFYMQIEEKYKKDYALALQRLKKTRKIFAENLAKIQGIRPIPSQANYIMVEIQQGITARELTKRMLVKHNLLIKDLSSKLYPDQRQYVRLAIRNEADNETLVAALRAELEDI